MLLEGGLDWRAMSLSPKDMDFVEAKNAAAREIALALGVPPMLLGIPGDNTYANYQEANRSFWRQTVLPLVARTANALANWLAPAWGAARLSLKPDLDAIEALASEREALWTRLGKATFLTPNEKRAAAGYGPLDGGGDGLAAKAGFNPAQLRVPAGSRDGGQWTNGGDEGHILLAQNNRPLNAQFPTATGFQIGRLNRNRMDAMAAVRRVLERDPHWRPPPSVESNDINGAIARFEHIRASADSRLRELDLLGHNQGPQLAPGLGSQQAFEPRLFEPQRVPLPHGFDNVQQFLDFVTQTRRGLVAAGYQDTEIYLRGSSVLGFRWRDGSPFDTGQTSDYDLAIVSPALMQRAEELRIPLRGQRTRTAPLDEEHLDRLNLLSLNQLLSRQAGRPVSLMIYGSRDGVLRRPPSIIFPEE